MVCAFNALHGVNPNWGQYKVHAPHAHTRAARSNVQGRGIDDAGLVLWTVWKTSGVDHELKSLSELVCR
jgi:hypothetical protein